VGPPNGNHKNPEVKTLKAIVMAGGEGTRLRPLTVNRPKPMVPICNRPVMEYVLELLKRHGVDTVIVTLHYLAEEVVSYFGDGSDFGLHIIYSVEDEPLGTAGSVKKVEEYLDDTFLVVSGDALTDFDLSRLLSFHRESSSMATVTLTRVESPLEYGVVITDQDHKIVRFLEKPSWGEVFSDQVNTGIYVLEPEILDLMEPDQFYDFSKDLFPKLLNENRPLFGYVAQGYWCDIGDLDHYRKAHQDMFAGRVLHEMPGEERSRGVWLGSGSEIDPTASIESPVVIGRNCRIRAGASVGQFTCIGDNCILEEETSLHRDILWNNVYLGRKSRSSGSIVSRQCTIKSNVTLSDGVVLGENVFVGRGALIFPQVKVWPDKNVEDGATVSMSLIWGLLAPGALFGQDGVTGLGNIEITPEFAMKLGAAYGSFLEKGSVVTTSRDAHPSTRLTNRALICGLCSVGVKVVDLQLTPAPISRYAIRNDKPAGGIHTRIHRDDARILQVQFFDSRGINIEKSMERKIENLFVRQDFRRTDLDEVGTIDFSARTLEQYLEGFTANVDTDLVRQAGFKAVIDYSYGNASLVLPSILGKLGTEAISLNAYMDPVKAHQVQESHQSALEQLSNIVRTLKADLGVMMDLDAERLSVVDEQGHILEGNALLCMMALMVCRQGTGALVAAPITAPQILDELAAQHGGKVIRTRTDSRSLMHTATTGLGKISLAGTPRGGFIFPSFSPGFDALFAFARLLEMMAVEKKPLSELARRIPPHHMLHETVDCSWPAKAKVMRLLVEHYRDRTPEMVDGVRVNLDQGSVLVIPHPTRARLNIWVEAETDERAQEILVECRHTLKSLEEADEGFLRPSRRTNHDPLPESESLPEERAFHFWTPGRYLGVQARSLREFMDILHYVEVTSLEYHLERGDFASWLESEMHRPNLAAQVRALVALEVQGETLREKLLYELGEGRLS